MPPVCLRIALGVEVEGEQTQVFQVYHAVAVEVGAFVPQGIGRRGVEGQRQNAQVLDVDHIVIVDIACEQNDAQVEDVAAGRVDVGNDRLQPLVSFDRDVVGP